MLSSSEEEDADITSLEFWSAGNCNRDDIVDFSENKEGASPAAHQKDDSNYDENYSSEEESDTCEQPAAEIQEAKCRESVSTGCKCRECNHFDRLSKCYVFELMTSEQGNPKCYAKSYSSWRFPS